MDEGDLEILKKGNVNKFILKLQKVKKSKNESFVSHPFDCIKSIRRTTQGWKITTEDQVVTDTDTFEKTRKGRNYNQTYVSQALTRAREKRPIKP